MKKRALSLLLSLVITAACFSSCGNNVSLNETTQAVEQKTTVTTTAPTTTTTTTTPAPEPAPNLSAMPEHKASALYCVNDDDYVFGSNINTKVSIASTTKMLTATVALKFFKLDDVITVGSEIKMMKPESTNAWLVQGHKLTFEQLLYALMLPSGNDAAYTLAVNTARKAWNGKEPLNDQKAVEFFVKMMNSYAAYLEMDSSHFANPEGWDDPQHYSTLSDMMKLAKYAYMQPELAKVVATCEKPVTFVSGETATWKNTNKLLDKSDKYYNPDCTGIKTGTTPEAGSCLFAAVKKDGKIYIGAVMGCKDDDSRYEAIKKVFENIGTV